MTRREPLPAGKAKQSLAARLAERPHAPMGERPYSSLSFSCATVYEALGGSAVSNSFSGEEGCMTLAQHASGSEPDRIDPMMPSEYGLVPATDTAEPQPVPTEPATETPYVGAWTNW